MSARRAAPHKLAPQPQSQSQSQAKAKLHQ